MEIIDPESDEEMLAFLLNWIKNLFDEIEKKNLIIREQEEDVSKAHKKIKELEELLYGETQIQEGELKQEFLSGSTRNYKI